MNKTLLSLLLISTVCATPAFANYFSNPKTGINLNIGSAPNPKHERIQAPARVEAPQVERVVEAAPPPRIVAPAPLPPPPVMRSFIVFFDFDRSSLTADAKQILATAVRTAMDTGMVRVLVTGHTDTVGSQRYNQALSERRAGSVKTEIVRLGLNARDISTVGKSFSEPLVATGPGVREPQNRRAVIDLGYNPAGRLMSSAE